LTFALLSRGEIACQVIRLRLRPYPLKAKAFIENQRGEGELVPFVRPQALTFEEIPYLIGQYERAARNTEAADFDGVEIHAANGYLIDQFIESNTNTRSDTYGGAIQNRARLLFEIVEALIPILGADRIGLRLSPLGKMNDINDDNPEATFGYIAERPSDFRLGLSAHRQSSARADAARREARAWRPQHGSLDPKQISGNLDCGGWLRRRERSALASRRLGRPHRVRPQIYRKPRFAHGGCASAHR
jgi:2,4-dienoyl-CoA reductase-like NADH-dependent reductase (Old Yellow Enzyme family)